jgi:hypothetical protein
MPQGLLTPLLDSLEPAALPVSFPSSVSRQEAGLMAAASPSNQQVVDACKAAYHAHVDAVDQTTLGGIHTAQSSGMQQQIAALNRYDWQSRVAAPTLASPVLDSQSMAAARSAVSKDSFLTFFVGIEMNLDVIIGGVGGVGVGFGFPSRTPRPLWMAYGGLRIALNIDIAINLTTGIFIEPPSEVAGDYLGIEVSGEPVLEGPSIGFGIHLTRDLSKVRGFSVSVGVELGVLPITAAVVFGSIATAGAEVLQEQASLPSTGR